MINYIVFIHNLYYTNNTLISWVSMNSLIAWRRGDHTSVPSISVTTANLSVNSPFVRLKEPKYIIKLAPHKTIMQINCRNPNDICYFLK